MWLDFVGGGGGKGAQFAAKESPWLLRGLLRLFRKTETNLPEIGGAIAKAALKTSPKIERQMAQRGWTRKMVEEAVESGEKIPAVNKATGNPATRYVHPGTGQSVVVDNVTGDVVHVGGQGFSYGPKSGDLP